MSTDVTVVVTAHQETAVAGPTMKSADMAVGLARERGLSVQTLICLRAASAATAAYFSEPRFDHWERLFVDQGDVGQARNQMVRRCGGRYVSFLEAGDLFSENWLTEAVDALDAARESGQRMIVHPEVVAWFDAQAALWLNTDQGSPLFSPHYFYFKHQHDSLFMAPREAHLDLAYPAPDTPGEHVHPDTQFTIESAAAGWFHTVVADTIAFRRRCEFPATDHGDRRRPLPRSLSPLAIDRVQELGRHSHPDRRGGGG